MSSYCDNILKQHKFITQSIFPNYISNDKFDIHFNPDYSSKDFVFLCVSTNAHRKNVLLLINTFKKAFANSPNIKLLLRVNDVDEHLLSPNDNIQILPPSSNMKDLYKQAHATVLASSIEGFGMPVLEGLLNGLPSVVPFHSGLLDFVNIYNSLPVSYSVVNDPHSVRDAGIKGNVYEIDPDSLLHQMENMVSVAPILSKTINRKLLYNKFANIDNFYFQ